jgi:hypothetical protein
MREVARLETLDLQVYKKISYEPEPSPTGALWKDVLAWAKTSLFPSRGRAIVFGTVHLGLDLSKLDARRLRIQGSRIEVAPPADAGPCRAASGRDGDHLQQPRLGPDRPAARARARAFEREVMADPGLQAKARGSAERARSPAAALARVPGGRVRGRGSTLPAPGDAVFCPVSSG